MTDTYVSTLSRAIAAWNAERHPPLDVIAALIAEGFNVPSLERAHWGKR